MEKIVPVAAKADAERQAATAQPIQVAVSLVATLTGRRLASGVTIGPSRIAWVAVAIAPA